jgi:hypothetical protein
MNAQACARARSERSGQAYRGKSRVVSAASFVVRHANLGLDMQFCAVLYTDVIRRQK